MDMHVNRARLWLLGAVTGICVLAALLWPAMAQPLGYHDFADCRLWLSIPNTLNVLSNLPFLVFGVMGIGALVAGRVRWHDPQEALPYFVFFIGAALTCLGSMYYHWAPDNPRLVWDRLPMTLAFAGLIAAVAAERLTPAWGPRSLWPLLVVGAASVYYWYITERAGQGNVVPYGIFQGWAILIVLLLLLLFPARRYTHGNGFWWPIAWYSLAKVAETFDLAIYRATATLASGHTIKHLLAALAVLALLRTLQRRAPLPAS
jgi:Ceramidase